MTLVTLVGGIMAPSVAFSALQQHLASKGIQVQSFIGSGKPINLRVSEIRPSVIKSDVVLVGLSTPEEFAADEMAAMIHAQTEKIPFGLYSDTYDVFRRPWLHKKPFHPFVNKASFLFLLCEEEKKDAQKLFPTTEIIASGNPTWDNFFFPRFSREEVRFRLKIQEDELAILYSLGTSLKANFTMLKILDIALSTKKNSKKSWKVIAGIHPGDQDFIKNGEVYYITKTPVKFVPKEEMSTMDIIPGVDFVVDGPGSSIGVNAAHLRKPVFCYCSREGMDGIEQAIGKRSWRPCELGVMLPVRSPKELAEAFHQHDLQANMTISQEKVYPKSQERGRALKIMTETLLKYGFPNKGSRR